MAEHYREHYDASDLVVTVAGAVDHDTVVEQLQEALSRYGWALSDGTPKDRRGQTLQPYTSGGLTVVRRPLEQVSLILGMPGLTASDPRRGTMSVLNAVLGTALGLLASAFASTEFQVVQFMPAFVFPQVLLGGLFIARDRLPAALETVGDVLPLSYGFDALDAAASGGVGKVILNWTEI